MGDHLVRNRIALDSRTSRGSSDTGSGIRRILPQVQSTDLPCVGVVGHGELAPCLRRLPGTQLSPPHDQNVADRMYAQTCAARRKYAPGSFHRPVSWHRVYPDMRKPADTKRRRRFSARCVWLRMSPHTQPDGTHLKQKRWLLYARLSSYLSGLGDARYIKHE